MDRLCCIGDLVISLGPSAVVPDVVGMTEDDAKSAIWSVNLQAYRHNQEEFSDTVPEGHVISQDPTAGTVVAIRTWIDLVISKGPGVFLPNVLNMTEDDAIQAIISAGLTIGSIEYRYSHADPFIPNGYVLYQSPQGGELVYPSTEVYLRISKGPPPETIIIPDVVGMSLEDACKAMTSAYGDPIWPCMYIFECSNTIPEDHIIGQYPAGGTVVAYYDFDIVFVVSEGPCLGTVEVPDVVGMAESTAGSAITSAGLDVGTKTHAYSDTVAEGRVISQNPTGGTYVPEGSDVNLVISLGSQPDNNPPDPNAPAPSPPAPSPPAPSPPAPSPPVPGPPVPAPPDESCLVAHWKLDETDGDIAYDSSVNDIHGMIYGNPFWQPTDGVLDGMLLFDGIDDYVFIDGAYQVPVYTITMWFRVDGGSDLRDLFSAYAQGVLHGILLEIREDGVLRYLHRYPLGIGGGTNIYTPATYDDGQWYHAAMVKSADKITLYINGEEVAWAEDNSEYNTADKFGVALGILDNEREPNRLFTGALDDVRIYNCPLTESEIMAVMAGAESTESECLMGYWSFDDRAGVTAYDSIGDYHCTIMDGAGGSPAFERGRYGQAIRFYGDGDHVLNEDFGSLINGLDALTVALWVKSDLNNTDKGFIIFEDPIGNDDRGMRYDAFGANGGGENVIKIGISSDNPNNNGRQQLESSSNVQTDEWQHIAMTWRSGEQLKLYINGILDRPTSNEPGLIGFLAGNTKLIIGKGGKDVGDGSWQGLIDDVCIYYCALNEDQIESLINGPPSLPLSPLVPSFPSLSSLSQALDSSLSFSTGGDEDWFSQTNTYYHDYDAAQSGSIKNNQESWMQTSVNRAGTLRFYWKVSSEGSCDYLEFYIDGVCQDHISGSEDWQEMTYDIPGSASHILEWRYVKDSSIDRGDDCGWVDKVEWMPIP